MGKRKRIEQLENMLLKVEQENKDLKKYIKKLEEKNITKYKYKGYEFKQWLDILYKSHYDFLIYDEKEKLTVFRYNSYRPLDKKEIVNLIDKIDNCVNNILQEKRAN